MASRTAWTAGNGAGLTWATLINSADLAAMSNGAAVRSTVADIANGTSLDQFMDVSLRLAIASSTIAAGAQATLYLFALLDDAATYGDNSLPTAGTQVTAPAPANAIAAVFPFRATAGQTILAGFAQGIIIPPGSFRAALSQLSGFALTTGTQTVMYRTYNQNLNN